MRSSSRLFLSILAAAACSDDDGVSPSPATNVPSIPVNLTVSGRGPLSARFMGEVWVHGSYAYTSTWGSRTVAGVATTGNTVYIWDIRGAPALVDSVTVPGAGTVGDVQVSTDGRYMVVPTEPGPGSIVTYDMTNPIKPQQLSVFTSDKITRGVHTCEIQTIGGRLYAFLAVNSASSAPARLMIVDLGDPLAPREVFTLDINGSFVHDVFVRDGILFTAQWSHGLVIFDIGGGGRGGSISRPVEIGRVATVGGKVHNVWWFHDPSTGAKQYAFVGEEGPASLFTSASGDVHVVDLSTMSAPIEVAFLNVPGAGAHNFSVDETSGFLYAAYYNAGVQVLDVRGNLGGCTAAQKASDGRCDLKAMGRLKAIGLVDQGMPTFVWGVHFAAGAVYASDMINGLWKLAPATR
ncbi:MAG: LVIVD repeat-containing protein [Gemmatimonadaceae bacterium]